MYIYAISLFFVANIFAAIGWHGANYDAGSYDDVWSLSGSIISVDPIEQATEYNSGKRWEITLENEIQSVLFWDFEINGNNKLILSNSTDTYCSWSTYSLWWNIEIESEFWWTMNFDGSAGNSFYCPDNWNMVIKFYSDQLGYKWIDVTTLLWYIFNVSEISIKWIADIKWDLDNLQQDVADSQEIVNIETTQVWWKLFDMSTSINKNISLITRNQSPLEYTSALDSFINTSNNDTYYYYDFQGETGNDNGLWNKWKNLLIQWYSTFFSPSNPTEYQVPVEWKNTLIVKGGNVYINADIYNKNDANDILIIIAKRDETNPQNGWNIYVNPWVTNIDAILIAEWSLMSYNWDILHSRDGVNIDSLRKQLLIYWTVITKNTIWENIAVYGTDEYIANGGSEVNSYNYNLANMRAMRLSYASAQITEPCGWDETKVIAMQANNVYKYAFAWKRECFFDDTSSVINLRTVENKLNPVVIEYNSNVSIINPYILKDN